MRTIAIIISAIIVLAVEVNLIRVLIQVDITILQVVLLCAIMTIAWAYLLFIKDTRPSKVKEIYKGLN